MNGDEYDLEDREPDDEFEINITVSVERYDIEYEDKKEWLKARRWVAEIQEADRSYSRIESNPQEIGDSIGLDLGLYIERRLKEKKP